MRKTAFQCVCNMTLLDLICLNRQAAKRISENYCKCVVPLTCVLLSVLFMKVTVQAEDGLISAKEPRPAVQAEWEHHFHHMQRIISNGGFLYRPKILSRLNEIDPDLAARGIGNDHIASAMDRQAFYHKTDMDPLDIVLRRTNALLGYLSNLPGWKEDRDRYRVELEKISQRAAAGNADKRKQLYFELCRLRRQLAFSNPLLDFRRLLFGSRRDNRNNVGFLFEEGKGVWVAEDPFGPAPQVKNVFKNKFVVSGRHAGKPLAKGAFSSLELSFDASKILFAWSPKNVSGRGLQTLCGIFLRRTLTDPTACN